MKIKVYTDNKNPVTTIACGKAAYNMFKDVDLKSSIGHSAITQSTRIVKDEYLKPMSFIGMDANCGWVFSCL